MDSGVITSVLVIALMGALAPVLADLLRRWFAVPTTVLEILLGILVGPAVLGLAQRDDLVDGLATLGLAMLFLLAGYEVDIGRLRGRPVRLAMLSWVGSLGLGLLLGAGLAATLGGSSATALVLGLALATTALGTILPGVRDAGLLPTRLGTRVMAVGAVGEFVPIVAVAVLLSGGRPGHASILLAGFALVALATVALARRGLPPPFTRLLAETLGTSAQFAVRVSVLVVLALVWLAVELHLDLVLGAFAAGVVVRQMLGGISRAEAEVVESKLQAVGYGVMVPFFFVTTGVRFDLPSLVASPAALVLLPVGLAGFLLVRGVPVGLAFRAELAGRERVALSLYASSALPLVVVVTHLAVENGWLDPAAAAGTVGAAMLSVLLFPLAAQRLAGPVPADQRR